MPRCSRVPSSCDRAATILGRVLDRYSKLAFAIGLLIYSDSSALLRLSVVVLLGLYAGAVARAWKITRTT